jgi:hypothetical protein
MPVGDIFKEDAGVWFGLKNATHFRQYSPNEGHEPALLLLL